MPRKLTQPPNTEIYVVKSSDTLASIALRYGTTPTELKRLNHLSTSMLFPSQEKGTSQDVDVKNQTLFVPSSQSNESNSPTSESSKIQDVPEIGQHTSESIEIASSPIKRVHSPLRTAAFSPDHGLEHLLDSDVLHRTLEDDEISTKYLKIKSKYVTDGQGVVSGVLLVTPQTVMFNPCVSDHLVMDRGNEMYMVRLSLKAMSRVTFFEDIAAMVLGDVSQQYLPTSSFIDYDTESIPKPGVVVCERSGEIYLLDPKRIEKSSPKNENITDSASECLQETLLDLNLTQFHDTTSDVPLKTILQIATNKDPPKSEDLSKGQTTTSIASGINPDNRSNMSTLPNASTDNSGNTDDTLTSASNVDSVIKSSEIVNKQDLSVFIKESHSSSTPKHSSLNDDPAADSFVSHTESIEDIDTITETSANDDTTDKMIDDKLITSSLTKQTIMSQHKNENNIKTTKSHLPHSAVISNLSPGNEYSKDSGISDVTSYSHQDSHESCQQGPSHSNHQQHLAQQARCSLSNEAQQWLGRRGIRLTSMDKDEVKVESPTDTLDEDVLPRPASKFKDPLMYVAIKVHKNFWYTNRTRVNNVMGIPPNRDQKRRQHWFAIPRERVDQFYSFLLHWAPDISVITSGASSTPSTPCSEDFLDSEEALNIVDNTFSHTPSPATRLGYEKLHEDDVASMKNRFGSINSVSSKTSSVEDDPPDLQAESQLLTRLQIRLLARCLPKRTVGHTWELVYSTNLHGISLTTLYRNFQDYDNPSLLVVKDENQKEKCTSQDVDVKNQIFGAFLSDSPRLSEGFYGTGESMLFSYVADNKVSPYHWSGSNTFFIKGSKTSFAIGGGEGVFGLWLDEDLYHGRSHACKTFDNEKLSYNEDFICSGLEAWAFV